MICPFERWAAVAADHLPSPAKAASLGTAGVIVALMAADLASAFETTIIFASIRVFLARFGDPDRVGWLITSYLLMAAAAAAVVGRLGDLYGRRRVLLIVLFVTALGSVISAATTNLAVVILGRALQGVSGAALPLSIGLARELLPRRHLPMAIATVTSTSPVGGALGFIVAGSLADHFHWSSIFLASALLAGLSFLVCMLFLPPTAASPSRDRLDLLGGLLFVPAVVAALLAITNLGKWGLADMRTLALMLAAIVVFAAWARHEWRHPNPLIDVRLLTDRRIALANAAMALFAFCGMQMALVQTLLLQQPPATGIGLGLSASLAGLLQAPCSAIAIVTGPLSGYLALRYGGRAALVVSLLIMASGMAGIAFAHDSLGWMYPMMLLTGAGITAFVTSYPNVIVAVVPPERTSEAMGVSSVVRSTAQGIGNQAIVALLATSTLTAASTGAARWPTPAAFDLVFVFLLGACALAGTVAFLLPGDRAGRQKGGRATLQIPAGAPHASAAIGREEMRW